MNVIHIQHYLHFMYPFSALLPQDYFFHLPVTTFKTRTYEASFLFKLFQISLVIFIASPVLVS